MIASVQRGDTTTFFSHLGEDPQVQMLACKETHFFDHEGAAVERAEPDYGVYHCLFEPWDGRLRGEASPAYIY